MPEEENKGPENKTPNGAVAVDPMGFNTIALIGDISEDTSNEVVYSLLLLKQKNAEEYLTTVLSMDE